MRERKPSTEPSGALGTAPVGKLLLQMAVPTIAAQLINMLYNIVDRVYIGHIPGEGTLALTGMGVCLPVIMLVTAFASFASSGGAARASIAMGRGDNAAAERILGNCALMQVCLSVLLTAVLLMLLGFGAKAGLFPLHGWLPTAHPAAPSPASAVLSGVITKAGVLGVLRLIYCFVGADFLRGTWVQTVFMALTLFTVFMGSLLAYQEQMLKKRLAYSSVSQVSYVLFGLSTLHPVGVVGALLHVACHALVKDTLFMSAGAIILKTRKTRVDELVGIGKQMPVTMWCFALASVGLVGIPPCLGFVSKWYLAQGALAMTGVVSWLNYLGPAVLLVSALLTAGYLLPIVIHAFFPGADVAGNPRTYAKCEPSWRMLIPLVLLTALSVLLGMFPQVLTVPLDALVAALM